MSLVKFTMILLPFTFALASASRADQMDEYITKMKSVVTADDSGVLCITDITTNKKWRQMPSMRPKSVICAGDMELGKGTIRERTGCSAFFLNLETLKMTPVTTFGFNMVDNKKCVDGGFEVLMNKVLYTDSTEGLDKPGKKVLVSEAFDRPFLSTYSDHEVVLIFSERSNAEKLLGQPSKYETWFRNSYGAFLKTLKH